MIAQVYKHGIRATARTLCCRTWVVEGRVEGIDGAVRILFAGYPADRAYLSKQLFSEIVDDYPVGRHWAFDAPSLAKKFECELSVTPYLEWRRTDRSGNLIFQIPSWLNGTIELHEADVKLGRTRSRRRDLRNIKKHGLTYRVTVDADELCAFYDDMYLPSMKASHGIGALMMSRGHMLDRLRDKSCELVLVLDHDRPVAGSLIAYDESMPRLWSAGILQGVPELRNKDVGAALYLMSYDYLFERGEKKVNIGRTRPFLNDGAMNFKRRFAQKLCDPTSTGYNLRVCRPTRAVVDTLNRNPFIHCTAVGLRIAAFARSGNLSSDEICETARDAHMVPGAHGVTVHLFEENPGTATDKLTAKDIHAAPVTVSRHPLAGHPKTDRVFA